MVKFSNLFFDKKYLIGKKGGEKKVLVQTLFYDYKQSLGKDYFFPHHFRKSHIFGAIFLNLEPDFRPLFAKKEPNIRPFFAKKS